MAEYEIVLQGQNNGNAMLTVLHYQDPTSGSINWQNVADVIRDDMLTNLQARLVPSVVYSGITWRLDVPGSLGTFQPFSLGDLVGTDPDPDTILQTAVLVRKLTDNGIRPGRGFVYQGGISSGASTGAGTWQGNIITDIEAYWEDMRIINAAGAGTLTLVIKASNPGAPNTVDYNPVSGVDAAFNPSNQNRRKLGRGS